MICVGCSLTRSIGKTTLCHAFLDLLTQPPHNLKLAVLSLDGELVFVVSVS